MTIITDELCAQYSQPGHPERPERIERTVELLRAQTEIPLSWSKPSIPEDSILLRAHTRQHLLRLEIAEDFDADAAFFPGIGERARASTGAALEALNCARKGEPALSLMRPPGHHATRHHAMGFCYLNNVAISVLHALETGTERVAVYDFDVHHGNGTEAILMNHP